MYVYMYITSHNLLFSVYDNDEEWQLHVNSAKKQKKKYKK